MAPDVSKGLLSVYIFILSVLIGFFFGTYLFSRSELLTVNGIQRYVCGTSHYLRILSQTPSKGGTSFTNLKFQRAHLYIGVMSTKANLRSRITALLDTWGRHPNVKLEIFANAGNSDAENGTSAVLPNGAKIVTLPGVPDASYPPQKKSFAMLKYMHDNHLYSFDWFMRADDDVYVKLERLLRLLNKLNSSHPLLIGQPGYGKHREDFLFGSHYCMGGTGVFLSRGLLRLLGPKLSTCMRQMYTEHEDIELGRCVRTMTNVSCTTAWEASMLFYQYYGGTAGQRDNIEGMPERKRVNAISFHSNKDPKYQYSLHLSVLFDRLKELLLRLTHLETETKEMSQQMLKKPSDDVVKTIHDSYVWTAVADQNIYSATGEAVRKIPSGLTEALSQGAFFAISSELQRHGQILHSQITHVVLKNIRYHVNALAAEDVISNIEVQLNSQEIRYINNVHLRRSFPSTMVFFEEPSDIRDCIGSTGCTNALVPL